MGGLLDRILELLGLLVLVVLLDFFLDNLLLVGFNHFVGFDRIFSDFYSNFGVSVGVALVAFS